jgi:hypothetical protein
MKKIFFILTTTIFFLSTTNIFAQDDGTFPIIFKNLATESFADSQIYVYLIGNGNGMNYHVDKNGVPQPFRAADNNAPDHITRNGKNYANYAVRLSDMQNFRSPAAVAGGRIYISLGEPVVLPVTDNGFAVPDVNNPSDPNSNICWDFYEYTYFYQKVPFGGNTTQVDAFGFPMTVQIKQTSSNYDQTVGIPMARDKVYEYYESRVSEPFKSCIGPNRIVAPRSAKSFSKGGAYENYMQPYIDSVWDYFTTNQFVWKRGNQTITGQVVNGVFQYTGGSMRKPTTNEVFACIGAFTGALGADFSAAFNRGVAKTPDDWYNPSKYYVSSPYKNEFAMVWHEIGLQKRAYGFAYDDVNDQSSVKILGNSNPLTSLTITIYPFKSQTKTIFPKNKKANNKPAICYIADEQILFQSTVPIESVSLLSINGKIVMKNLSINKNIINTNGVAKGIYYMKLKDKEGYNHIVKFIKKG